MAVKGVLVLPFDGGVGQGRVDDRHVRAVVPEHGQDGLDSGVPFGELGAEVCRKRCAVMLGRPAESTKPAAVQAALRERSNKNALDSS